VDHAAVSTYFNNDWRVFAPAKARGLRSRLRTELDRVPAVRERLEPAGQAPVVAVEVLR
jgi:hypothetical protein